MLTTRDILFEDNHLIIVNKPAGILSQGDNTGDISLLDEVKKYIKIKYDKPGDVYAGLAHRLDRPVSGVVIICKTSKSLTRINEMFKNREIEKKYIAISHNRPKEIKGEIVSYLVKDSTKNKVTSSLTASKKNKSYHSVTNYELVMHLEGKSVFQLDPLTGRPHQLRVHLSSINCPIWGDVKYGSPKSTSDKSIALHCKTLQFVHPVTKIPLVISAPFPSEVIWNSVRYDWDI
jgi:23S rRNA pseudouridine1911/1915/1917 synthase